MKKLLAVFLFSFFLFIPSISKATLGDLRLYIIWNVTTQEQGYYNYGTATALIAQLLTRIDSDPGVAGTNFTEWVQAGRIGEDASEWYFSEDPALPIGKYYVGGWLFSESVAVDSNEDTDYVLTTYYDANFNSGDWTVMVLMTNRAITDYPIFQLIEYCTLPFSNTPSPKCP